MGDKSAAVIRASVLEPTYGFRLHLSISDDPYKQAKEIGLEEGDKEYDAAFYVFEWPMAYIFFRHGCIEHGIIYHEIDHVVHHVLRDIGILESASSVEAYTYLGQWITRWIYGQLKKNKVAVN